MALLVPMGGTDSYTDALMTSRKPLWVSQQLLQVGTQLVEIQRSRQTF
jgi:hypothetical protein